MEHNFQVENIRCGGCANTISKKLKEISGVESVEVNIEDKKVTVTTDSTSNTEMRQALSDTLAKLGYPEVGTEDANSLKTKACSIVSCAIGKVS